MNNETDDFDAALTKALSLSGEYSSALQTVTELTRQFSKSVARITNGTVRVDLKHSGEVGTVRLFHTISSVLAAAQKDTRPRELGDDVEDKQYRRYVVASAVDHRVEPKILWEIELDQAGYPLTLRGPGADEVQLYYAEDEIRHGFMSAAGHGLVGRKISALRKTVTKDKETPSPEVENKED